MWGPNQGTERLTQGSTHPCRMPADLPTPAPRRTSRVFLCLAGTRCALMSCAPPASCAIGLRPPFLLSTPSAARR